MNVFCCYRFGFNPAESFVVPADVAEHFAAVKESGSKKEADYNALFAAYEVTDDNHYNSPTILLDYWPTVLLGYWPTGAIGQRYSIAWRKCLYTPVWEKTTGWALPLCAGCSAGRLRVDC